MVSAGTLWGGVCVCGSYDKMIKKSEHRGGFKVLETGVEMNIYCILRKFQKAGA